MTFEPSIVQIDTGYFQCARAWLRSARQGVGAAYERELPRVGGSLVAALALAGLCACSTADKVAPVAPQAVLEQPGKRSVSVSDVQSGASIVLEPAQELAVVLRVDSASPRDWSLVDLKPGVLTVLGSKFERTPRNAISDEFGATSVWRLKAEAPGTAVLRFELRRPRSLEPAVQIVTYAVTVR